MNYCRPTVIAFVVFLSAPLSFGQNTAEEAKAMLVKAVDAVKANKAKALDMFNKGEGGFRDRNLYVFCINVSDSKFVAMGNPNEKQLLGVDERTLKDVDGNPLRLETASEKAEGEITVVDYEFSKPGGDKRPAPKQSYLTKVGDLICGVGYYYFYNEKE